jgi:CRISPR-associated protein Cas1
MSTTYITSQGGNLIKEGNHLVLQMKNESSCTIFTFKLDQLVIFGRVNISTPAIQHLLGSNIETIFLTRDGRYLGRLVGKVSRNILLRKIQFKKLDDEEFIFNTARSIIRGKLRSYLTLLQRINRTHRDVKLNHLISELSGVLQKMNYAQGVNRLRGYEGKGTAIFFRGFQSGFIEKPSFTRRVRRPPTDPVNALLSLGYTFLMNRVYSAVNVAGLDPYLGSLHVADYGRPSLALDLMEEFRPIIVDTLVLSLFNLGILKESDFRVIKPDKSESIKLEDAGEEPPDIRKDSIALMEYQDEIEEEEDKFIDAEDGSNLFSHEDGHEEDVRTKYPVRLTSEGMKKVIEQFERKMTTMFFYEPLKQRISYHKAIMEQTRHFVKYLRGETTEYRPLQMR